jgi:hypothetical protein
MTMLYKTGKYRSARVSASGQRKGARIEEEGLAGDIISLSVAPGLPHLLVEVGGIGKRLGTAFDELRGSILPGFVPIVVRFVHRKCWIYVDEDNRFASFSEALDALAEA